VFRLLITGSRIWRDRAAIERGLALAAVAWAENPVLVSGACPDGADRIAEDVAESWGWQVERHAADWSGPCRDTCKPGHRKTRRDGISYCPAAGNYRNAEMVELGADACIAFRRGGAKSTGTTHCGQLAEKAGIPTTWIEAR
jgi:hypothetical protein